MVSFGFDLLANLMPFDNIGFRRLEVFQVQHDVILVRAKLDVHGETGAFPLFCLIIDSLIDTANDVPE